MLVKSPPIKQSQPPVSPVPAAPSHARGGRPGQRFVAAIQAVMYALACIGALELAFAFAHVGEAEYLMPDRIAGFTLMPNKVITQRLEGFGSFKTNSFGMQNDEITVAKPAGVLRIAIFGDSFVESMHVDRDKSFLQVLQKQLGEKLRRPVQVLNFGVSNYSVAQDYLRYEKLAKQFKPDLVIQVFRVEESDKLLPQTSSYLSLVRPVFFVGPQGQLVYDDTNVKAFFNSSAGKKMVANQWLRHNSHLYCLAGQFSQTLSSVPGLKKKEAAPAPAADFTAAEKPASQPANLPAGKLANAQPRTAGGDNKAKYIACYWYMMDKQLESFRNECLSDGAAFMILRTPMIKAELDSLRDNATETRLLYQTAERISAPILNLDSLYKNQFGPKNDGKHFLCGGHFNKDMHNWVGTHLADYLAQEGSGLLTGVPKGASK